MAAVRLLKCIILKRLRVASASLVLGTMVLTAVNPQSASAAPAAIFGREELFTLNSGNISALKASGFNTVILFVVDVEANGDLNYNGDHLIVQNGTWVGDTGWASRLAALRAQPTTINRIEVCTGGAGAQSWNNIKNLIASQGTGSGSILYRNFQTLKNTLHIDAICNDDEVAFDSGSAAQFNRMITTLGMWNTLCPYNNPGYWQNVFNNSSIDKIYLQCYDGGAGNNPGTWDGYFGGFKVQPGDWNNDTIGTVRSKFAGWASSINGGFMWQLESMGDGNLARYAGAIGAIAGTHTLVNQQTGMAAENGGSTVQGAGMIQWSLNYGPAQQWTFTQNSDTSWNIISAYSGYALDDPGFSTQNGTQMDQWGYNGGSNQKWWIDRQSDGSYKVWNQYSSGALDGSSSSQNGYPLVQWGWNGGSQQRWNLQ